MTKKAAKEIRIQEMEGKKWKKKRNKPGQSIKNDMDEILTDPRFTHVSTDLKLRHVPKETRKVKLDSRFHSVLTDDKFYEKSIMDPRGRKGNYSTKEDLLKFYHMSSDEDTDDEENDDKRVDGDENDSRGDSDSDEEKSESLENVTSTKLTECAVIKKEEEKENNQRKGRKEKIISADSEEEPKISEKMDKRLQDMTQDYARGEVLFSDDSSDDDSTTSDEDGNDGEFEWGELDQDAVWDNADTNVEETSRIAVCNLDWDRIKAADIMVLFSSFCPRGGSVKKVTIYPSEYGKQRMVEENTTGPQELKMIPGCEIEDAANDQVDLDKLEKGMLDENAGATKAHYEALRQYQRNRLRYYYAVVECNSIDTAKVLYQECDRKPYEGAGILLDLRYIPSDMTFDETPHDVCETVPKSYEVKTFITTALHDSRPILTWDETDPERKKTLSHAMSKAMKGEEINEDCLKGFLASSSEEDNSDLEDEEVDSDSDDEGTKASQIAKFRALINEIDEKERKKKENDIDMEETFNLEEDSSEKTEQRNKEDANTTEQLNPFEKYLEKRKNKRKEREKRKKKSNQDNDTSIEEDCEPNCVISDDELPDGVGDLYSDPFFAEELKKMDGTKDTKKKKKSKKDPANTEVCETNEQKDLELLLMDEDAEDKKHFSMREIIENNKEKKKRRKKKAKKQQDKLKQQEKLKQLASEDCFKVNIADSRFAPLLTSGDYNIDPSHPQFKRTKAMDNLISDVQKKRIAESFESIPDAKRKKASEGKNTDHELSLLIKRVKNKTNKPKKKQ